MASRRMARMAEAIRETCSTTILFELKDPRVKGVTVLDVEVAPDLRAAKVYVSVMGEPRVQALSMHGLNAARGFLQSKVADRLQTRYTPLLTFVLDPSVKKSVEASRLLRDVLPADVETAMVDTDDGMAADADDVATAHADDVFNSPTPTSTP